MPPHSVDTNVLLRSAEEEHSQHQIAKDALQRLVQQGAVLFVFPQNLREFWNVCTRPRDKNGLGKTLREADIDLQQIEASFQIAPETFATYQEWRRLVVHHQVSGVQVHDANLAAAMNTHGITHLLTFNGRDFARYTNITTVDPITI